MKLDRGHAIIILLHFCQYLGSPKYKYLFRLYPVSLFINLCAVKSSSNMRYNMQTLSAKAQLELPLRKGRTVSSKQIRMPRDVMACDENYSTDGCTALLRPTLARPPNEHAFKCTLRFQTEYHSIEPHTEGTERGDKVRSNRYGGPQILIL